MNILKAFITSLIVVCSFVTATHTMNPSDTRHIDDVALELTFVNKALINPRHTIEKLSTLSKKQLSARKKELLEELANLKQTVSPKEFLELTDKAEDAAETQLQELEYF